MKFLLKPEEELAFIMMVTTKQKEGGFSAAEFSVKTHTPSDIDVVYTAGWVIEALDAEEAKEKLNAVFAELVRRSEPDEDEDYEDAVESFKCEVSAAADYDRWLESQEQAAKK